MLWLNAQPSQPAREQGLAQSNHDKDMAGVVQEITYGDLWGSKHSAHKKEAHHGGFIFLT
jgi:hypothetical protein